MVQNDDAMLLARLRSLQEDALADVYDTYSPVIYTYAYRLLGDSDLAEECVAETFYRLLNALRNGGGATRNLRPYLYRVAHNWITDFYRQQPLQPLPLVESSDCQSETSIEHQVEGKWMELRMRAALQRLTPEQSLVVNLRFIEGLDQETVAEALGKPLSAVKALQHRGLQALKRMLISEESFTDER